MEFLCTASSPAFQSSVGSSLFSPNFLSGTQNKKSPFIYSTPYSKFCRNPSFTRYLCFPRARSLQVFAHFVRSSSRRRNSLRKKLIDDQQVHNSIPQIPTSKPDSIVGDGEGLELNQSRVEENYLDQNVVEGRDDMLEHSSHGKSLLWNKLDNWVDQYKKDVEFWGIGSAPIFTVFQDSNGNVKWVSVNEDEILKRSKVERHELEDRTDVNSKILHAESLAREMENGKNVIPRNSSVAKFVVQGGEPGFLKAAQGFTFRPVSFTKLSRIGSMVLCSFIVLWALKKFLTSRKKEIEYTEMEKEMMRRKIKSRKEREIMKDCGVEIVDVPPDLPLASFEKPKLDKQEVINSITKAKASCIKQALVESLSAKTEKSVHFDSKIQEIKDMAREARKMEAREHSMVVSDDEEQKAVNEKLPNDIQPAREHDEEGELVISDSLKRDLGKEDGLLSSIRLSSMENRDFEVDDASNSSRIEVPFDTSSTKLDLKDLERKLHSAEAKHSNIGSEIDDFSKPFARRKLRVIKSVKEAREYFSEKRKKQDPDKETRIKTMLESVDALRVLTEKELGGHTSKEGELDYNLANSSISIDGLESLPLSIANNAFPSNQDGHSKNAVEEQGYNGSILNDKESILVQNDPSTDKESILVQNGSSLGAKETLPVQTDTSKDSMDEPRMDGGNLHISYQESTSSSKEVKPYLKIENWIEENFGEVEPVVKKIGVGFRDNYMIAREKASEQLNTNSTLPMIESDELEWMKDENLSEIVFQVRENELAGRDPFYAMDAEDKLAFFKGLEKKVEVENEKMLKLHEWLHSNIENLDYGVDGISLYDPPEKIIPRWKGPILEKSPAFYEEFLDQRRAIFGKKTGISNPASENKESYPTKSTDSDSGEASVKTSDQNIEARNRDTMNSKTIIEGSDGSVKAGKKTGKEFWQHTKKWSQGFLDSYNEVTDPEIKSIMRDMGKDLDRWITEKEIQEAAELMDKLPERNKQFMEKKLSKLRREMELFGPQAVVNKYSEYADVKEEDNLWWLDLPHVLCIELYTDDDGDQRIGLYSLEMAVELELEPKPYHVIAFENVSDCKNLCCIIQSQMEMQGNGNAFVVARPPKEAFREAKANGFAVTVIRKGELLLSVDQTLEEVEEKITEIGSKMYHDEIMRGRSVDISSLMKGVFGFGNKPKPPKRKRSKRMLKKPRRK